jgi:hypothetical protein
MHTPQEHTSRLPLGLRLVAGYFILVGVVSLLLPLFYSGTPLAEFEAKPAAYKVGARARSLTVDVLYIVCGVGLFRRRRWARKLGLWVLVATTFYGAFSFAWGFAHGKPAPAILAMSFAVVGAWCAIWFFLLYRQSSAQALS